MATMHAATTNQGNHVRRELFEVGTVVLGIVGTVLLGMVGGTGFDVAGGSLLGAAIGP
jgi:hypothetical protein